MPQLSISKSTLRFTVPPFLQKISQFSIMTLFLQAYPSIYFTDPFILYLFPECLLIFLSNLYDPPYLGRFSNLWCSDYLKIYLSQKIESRHFYSCPPGKKSPLGSFHCPNMQRDISYLTRHCFFKNLFSFAVERGEGL